MRKLILFGAGALLALGCASRQRTVAKVDDSGLARLSEDQMQPVDDARIEEGRANDAVARAKAAEADARARAEVAKSEKEVSAAQLKRSQAELDLLKKQYAPKDQVARAEQDIHSADERIKATDLKIQYLNQMIALAETERKAAEAHVATAHAATQQAKYRAMKSASVPHADAVNVGDLDRQMAEAQAHEAELQKNAADQRSNAVSLYNRWQSADSSSRTLARPENVPTPSPVSEPGK
jgi:hypothetical protein